MPKLAFDYYRLLVKKEPVLRSVDFATTFECVCHCKHCYAAALRDDSRELLDFDKKKKVIKEALDLGAVAINFVGGEPLCDPDLVDLVASIPPSQAVPVVTSNGVILDERMIERLANAGLGILAVSIDDPDPRKHDRFRGRPGAFNAAVSALEAARARKIECIVNSSITEEKLLDNRAGMLVAMARAYGASINLSLPSPVGRWQPNGFEKLSPRASQILDDLMARPHVRWDGDSNWLEPGCGAGREKITITAYGDVLPCGLIQNAFGNIKDEPLRYIWHRMTRHPMFNVHRNYCPTAQEPGFLDELSSSMDLESGEKAEPPPLARPMIKIPRAKVYFPPQVFMSMAKAAIAPRPKGAARAEFEEALAARAGRKYCITCASGRLALWLSMKVLGAEPGQKIVLPSYTCRVILPSLYSLGLQPLFVDVIPGDYNMDPASVQEVADKETRFLLLTHIHGRPARVEELLELADKKGWHVVEDAAAAFGARTHGRPVGSFGRISYTSLSMYKPWNALGGGALFTDDPGLARKAREVLKKQAVRTPSVITRAKRIAFCTAFAAGTHPIPFSIAGWPVLRAMDLLGPKLVDRLLVSREEPGEAGVHGAEYEEEFGDFESEIGLAQLARAEADDERRRRNSAALAFGLRGSGIDIPDPPPPETKDIALNFVVRVPERNKVIRKLRSLGIDSMPGYVEACSSLVSGRTSTACPVSESLMEDKLYLPNHPPLTEKQMRFIASALHQVIREIEDRNNVVEKYGKSKPGKTGQRAKSKDVVQ
ncbi:MAG: radical SAM protein [Deltaproteobacteria bacterium]|nr:radical SAM protein [Deltaproteobacteria bacterium]